MLLNQPQTSADKQPSCKCKRTEQGGEHDHAGRKGTLMSHVFRHNVAGHCGGRAKHDQNGNQLVMGEPKMDGNRKEDGAESNQLQESTCNVAFGRENTFPK